MTRSLCDTCAHQKLVHNTRGSTFSMCLRHRDEPERFQGNLAPRAMFPKYPRLPVTACAGYEPSTTAGADSTK